MATFAANVVTENGEQFIPASQRPDGTWRKARRVKGGYVPQEEVPLYESKGKQFVAKQQTPVVLPTGETAKRVIPGLFILPEDKTKKSQKKPKNKLEEINKLLSDIKISTTDQPKQPETTDPAKKLRNLKKRLKEIEGLEEKIKAGQLAKPEAEQLAKIKRKNELLVQIRDLEKELGL